MSSAPTGFPQGKSGGSRPAHLSIPEREGKQRKFPGDPRRPSQYLEAVGRGRWLLPGFRETGVGTESGEPSGGRPRGGAWRPAVWSQSGGGGARGVQLRSGWSRARTAAEKRSRNRREKRREQDGRDTRPRFPPGVRTPDHGLFCRGSPLGSLTFLASRTRGAGLAGVGVLLSQGWDAEQQQVGLGCGSL